MSDVAIPSITHSELLKLAVAWWGGNSQWNQLQEECAELIVAISHMRREREGSSEKVADEIADVHIMLEQAKLMLAERIDVGADVVERRIAVKMMRLRERLKKAGAL